MHVHIIDSYFLIFQGRNDLMAIGLNSFEVLHLGTYFPELLANYVKVANTLEADTNFTKHLQKEAADPQESDDASTRLTLLANQQQVWVIFFGTHLQTVFTMILFGISNVGLCHQF